MARFLLHLTRQEAIGLKVGGSERISCWLTKPRREVVPEDGIFRSVERWVSDTRDFNARAFRKAGAHDLDQAIWTHMEETSFPGIAYDDWDRFEGRSCLDHPDAVPFGTWIGEIWIEFSLEPREGLFPMPLTLTGPFGERTMYREPDRAATPIAWLGPPMLQPKERFLPEPFDGVEPRDFWTQPGRQGSVGAGDFAKAGLTGIGDRIAEALASGHPDSRLWSCEVPLWVGLAKDARE